jgi:hypothetical protein
MRQHCEACDPTPRGAKLIGVILGESDVLLCTDHALLALDTEMRSLDELKELLVLLADEPTVSTRRSAGRGADAARRVSA